MAARYLLLLVAIILQSSAKQNDIYYVVDNGLESNNQNAANNGFRGSLYNFKDIFKLVFQNQVERVKIQLYYECLCPDCRAFDNQQFKETILKLGPHLDVNLYPYGNAKTVERDGHIEFICQHGPQECYGNKLHACAIDYLKNITAAVVYNSCMMESTQAGEGSDNAAADVCGRIQGINSKPIKLCAQSTRGTQLLKYYGEESKKANFNSVPHILINGIENNGAHFMQDVCKAFRNPPAACNGLIQ